MRGMWTKSSSSAQQTKNAGVKLPSLEGIDLRVSSIADRRQVEVYLIGSIQQVGLISIDHFQAVIQPQILGNIGQLLHQTNLAIKLH